MAVWLYISDVVRHVVRCQYEQLLGVAVVEDYSSNPHFHWALPSSLYILYRNDKVVARL